MVATVIIERLTGAGPTRTDLAGGNTRANAEDVHSTGDTASPIEIPTAGTNYSFWVNTQLNATVAPDNLIDNIEWFTDGVNSYGTGIGLLVAQAALASYTLAPGTIGVTGTELNDTNYTGGTLTPATPTDAFAEVTGAPLTVTGSTTTTGAFGNIVVWQVTVLSTASPGTKPATPETITWRFDET
ncbi:hypothetical protein LCGC14_2797420 [marine sediment metagenome]|uniref:WxL domain-containing protein n=1 Tax=marine sediment metagenome TaxID=412755 RepID=A0A0F8ZAT1_9ZZZZ